MDKALFAALQFDAILDLIRPAGEAGRVHKQHLSAFKPGREAALRKEYKRLECLAAAMEKDKKLSGLLYSALSQTPYLPQTLKALQQRTLFLHECFEIKKLTHYALQLRNACTKAGLEKLYPFPELQKLYDLLDPEQTQSPSFALSAGFDPMLAKLLSQLQELQLKRRHAEHLLLQKAQKAAGLNNPVAEIVVSRLDDKKLENLRKSGFYVLSDENFANLTFRLLDSPELAAIKQQITSLTQKLVKVEEQVLVALSNKIKAYHKALDRTAELVKLLDWDYAKAVFAIHYKCVIPAIAAKVKLDARRAVNLPLQQNLAQLNRKYQPLDLHFDATLNVLTGPNMGGKTTALHTVGQLCLMVSFAIPVPAEQAELCLFDHIWHNRENEGGENLSSFGREIVSLAAALRKKGRTLFIPDELAKGTNPAEGEALLTAVLQYLADQPCLVLAATHYDISTNLNRISRFVIRGIDAKALKSLAKADKATLDAQLDQLNRLMDYSLVRVSDRLAPPQNAIPIAQILGLPQDIIKMAESTLKAELPD
jgi:DNA mismatch repair protein MutS2